ncbi:uncharacterized protein LOC126106242 [Schistocerca cancellata]|uniref:uncharacterized protein LOC126106242 n=1 Tax=Schistocerca cancellata TaxID=274614 RepID=UPI0021195BB7|nr:uncharacterized protein LOC126106242 [Schistocerca cancellata]
MEEEEDGFHERKLLDFDENRLDSTLTLPDFMKYILVPGGEKAMRKTVKSTSSPIIVTEENRGAFSKVLHPTPGGVKRRYDANIVRLQQGWKSYMSHPVTFKDVCERTVYLLYRYSLQVVLSPDWQPTSRWSKSLKSELNDLCLTTSSLIVNNLCYRLKQIVNRPWKHPILRAIIYPDTMELDDRQVAKYFRDEGETMVWTRLEVLCENSTVTKNILKHNSQHKIAGDSISPALSYVTQVLRYLTNKGKFHEKDQNTDVLCAGCPLDIQDAFLALLAREGKIDEMRHYMYENMSLHAVSNMRERIRNWPGRLPASLASQLLDNNPHEAEE